MRLRTVGLAAALTASLSQTSDAVVQPKGADAPVVMAGRGARVHRAVSWSRGAQLASLGLPGWTAIWDRDTDVPLRLWGPGIAAPGAMADAPVAEAAARRFLSTHLATLAPGAAMADFVVVSNQLGGARDVRSVGFAQHVGGVRVLGAAIGVSFKRDRLVMVGSTAVPHAIAPIVPGSLSTARLASGAIGWLATDGHAVRLRATPRARVIVPVVRRRGATGPDVQLQLAEQLEVEAVGDVGRWDVWVDAATATPIARRTRIHYASGRVLFDVPDRAPTSGTRSPKIAAQVSHLVDGVPTVSDVDGTITWAGGTATIAPGLRGPRIAITNKEGALLTDTLSLDDGGDVVWSKATDEFGDAQLSAFVFATTAKNFARARLAPDLAWLDEALDVVVNEMSTCNAYSTGDDIHFYRSKWSDNPLAQNCQNTGRLADVVYHEFGHSLHANSIIEGVGQFDGALSEGVSDMFAAFITKDSGMGRGFFFGDAPLRELDPSTDKRWPEDTTGEVHDDGEIIAGTLWDLRKALIAKHGEQVGDEHALKIYYGILQRAADIPSSFAEALLSDDDDGDLSNGTPNQCQIQQVFGAHGLADPRITLGLGTPTRDGLTISMTTNPPANASACPGATVASMKLDWRVRGGAVEAPIVLEPTDTTYRAQLPSQPSGTVVQYKVSVVLTDGSTVTFPVNAADPYYELYVGEVDKVWCADFENGADDWQLGADPTTRNEWEVGLPQGLGGDPRAAHGGQGVLGTDLTNDGVYKRNTRMWAESPEIDLMGNTENIRVQYYRWLGVEDGFFDNASIHANDVKVWGSYASSSEPAAPRHHIDREWQFHDVDVSSQVASGKLKLRFELASDPGFSLGGWNLDDVCVVIARPPPACEVEGTCGDGEPVIDNGFCSTGGGSTGAVPLLFAVGLLVRRRRRR